MHSCLVPPVNHRPEVTPGGHVRNLPRLLPIGGALSQRLCVTEGSYYLCSGQRRFCPIPGSWAPGRNRRYLPRRVVAHGPEGR